MSLVKQEHYTYNDVTILPCVISEIEHRIECNPFDENGMLPLFTAPMDTVVGKNNFDLFESEKIYAILPRTENLNLRMSYSSNGKWAAYSLSEFESKFCDDNKLKTENKIKVLIDVANGHMKKIFELVKRSKGIYGDKIVIMVGNIANPNTYEAYADVGADYIRLGIGGGMGCLSSSNLGIHMPMASLIDETVKRKKKLEKMGVSKLPKIIADGGIRNYSDIIKAYALGADYVMVGSVFARMLESSAVKKSEKIGYLNNSNLFERISRKDGEWYLDEKTNLGDITAIFYGMASREGQIALNGEKTKTSEGLLKRLKVEYNMHGWVNNFTDYLRSAMSYVGSKDIQNFSEHTTTIVNSTNAILAVNK